LCPLLKTILDSISKPIAHEKLFTVNDKNETVPFDSAQGTGLDLAQISGISKKV
jgi:hypothetical protein